jgi:DNA polymerase-3 subunit delta'
MTLDWLRSFADGWRQRERRARQPHAVLLAGAPGLGKRAAAAWLARRHLQLGPAGELPEYPAVVPEHPDLHWLVRPEDKHTIGIDLIRELIADLSLTSYQGGGKVAVIDPAHLMTRDAANSLLKTLEEPPGDVLLILIADRMGRLPATIFSRCQRIAFVPPPEGMSIDWLRRLRPEANWQAALDLAGGAPLAAVEALETLDQTDAMARDFSAVAEGRASPLDVAARWSKFEPEFVLHWLCRQVQRLIHGVYGSGEPPGGANIPESVLASMDRRNLFCYLDAINRLRGQPGGSFNVLLTLESLLLDWASGLVNCGTVFQPGALLPRPNQGRTR